jgi:hypothetical protein
MYPGKEGIFICPICLREFTEEEIDNKILQDGHVWPAAMRKKSKLANDQSVLLCTFCNNTAGSHGDKQMQMFEKIKEKERVGELYGIRKVEITENADLKPIRMVVKVSQDKDGSVNLEGSLNEKKQWLGSSPEDQARFVELAKRSMKTQQQVGITIHPLTGYKQNLVEAGWITSAYLMAFYSLGYWYILNEKFNFIREYIISSFDSKNDNPPKLQPTEDFHIYTNETVNFPDPQIRISFPYNSNENIRLEVCFLKYEISLPIILESNLSKRFLDICLKRIPNKPFKPLKEGDSPCLYVYIHCTKTIEHACPFDNLLVHRPPKFASIQPHALE